MADNNMETRVSNLETKTSVIEAKIDAFIQSNEDFKRTMRETMTDFKNEMRETMTDFKQEMRQQNEMRANEITDLRNEIRSVNREVRNLFIAFLGIIVAIMIGMFWNNSNTTAAIQAVKQTNQQTNQTAVAQNDAETATP